jgi:lysine 2,3-aminomutase
MKKRTAVTVRAVVPREPEVSAEEAEPPGTIADKVGSVSPSRSSLGRLAGLFDAGLPAPGIESEHAPRASPRSLAFRASLFPEASPAQWQDWRWQMRHRIRDRAGLERILRLSEPEQEALDKGGGRLPLSITPYYASLLDPDDPGQALRRTVVPSPGELVRSAGEAEDPLSEDRDSPVPGLVHRYPDRVLFLVTGVCSVYCRYCTRSRMVGSRHYCFEPGLWEAALGYIAGTPAVRDVLLSGGDPLTMPGERLELLLGRLRAIPHVEIIRIGTKVPVVLPQRVTSGLVRMLRRFHPLWMSIHFTHPDELTPEVALACSRLADGGIPLGSQTVLLKGINDGVETMRELMHGLMRNRVRPYYLYQCDPISGSAHFRTPVGRGLEIIQGLRGHTSGYAVPTFVVDAPGGGGKIPLVPDPKAGREDGDLLLRNFQGKVFRYPDTAR